MDALDSVISLIHNQTPALSLRKQLDLIAGCPITPFNADVMRKQCVVFLTQKLNLILNQSCHPDEALVDEISSLISRLSSVGGPSRPLEKTWDFAHCSLKIRELSFEQVSFGWQTWGSAAALAE
jgi:hypothetical protein